MNFGETFSSTELIIRTWFEKNKRELPWRQTRDPYSIWISEVILQQTRVEQGLEYYNNFMESFPDVASLARAEEDQVLNIWQGLGYYSRARNLHKAAKDVVELRKGVFPRSYEDLLELKGVGPYSAAAIASICFGEARAVVDGNVSRVIARLYGVEEAINRPAGARQIGLLAQELMDQYAGRTPPFAGQADRVLAEPSGMFDPGLHNQAMMEFGALCCTPVSPGCEDCPLSGHCRAKLSGKTDQLPLKIRGRKPVDRWYYFYIISSGDSVILEKRGLSGIWRSLYQFPLTESNEALSEQAVTEAITRVPGMQKLTFRHLSETIRHPLSHRTIYARFIHAGLSGLPPDLPPGWIMVPVSRIDHYPVPRLIHRYLDSVKI